MYGDSLACNNTYATHCWKAKNLSLLVSKLGNTIDTRSCIDICGCGIIAILPMCGISDPSKYTMQNPKWGWIQVLYQGNILSNTQMSKLYHSWYVRLLLGD